MPSESGDHVTTGLHATHHKATPTPLMLPGPGVQELSWCMKELAQLQKEKNDWRCNSWLEQATGRSTVLAATPGWLSSPMVSWSVCWAVQYNTWLLIQLTPKAYSFLFFSFLLVRVSVTFHIHH